MGGAFEIIVIGLMLVGALLILYMALTELSNFLMTRVPFVPTKATDVKDLAQRLQISEADFFIDLGSGNGKVLFVIERYSGAKTKGFQRAGWTHMYAKLKKWLTGSEAQLVSGNFFAHPWSEATVVYAYLYPPLMRAVGDKAIADCRPGTRLVTRDFFVPQLTPDQTWQTPSGHEMFLYVL
jgi:hypothetical protein